MNSDRKNNDKQTTPQATENLESSRLSEDELEAVAGGSTVGPPMKFVPPKDWEFGPGHVVILQPIRTKM